MGFSKHSSSSPEDRKLKTKTLPIKNDTEEKITKNRSSKEVPQPKKPVKMSMIPRLIEKNKEKDESKKSRNNSNTPILSFSSKAEYENKLKLLKAKEKSIAEHYKKIQEHIEKMMAYEQQIKGSPPKSRSSLRKSPIHKITSDPLVFNNSNNKKEQIDVLEDVENNINQITDVWTKTSSDLYSALRSLKKNPSIDPMEVEVESERIQQVVEHARSVTLSKTRSIITEVKKLLHHKEMIRTELENFISNENFSVTKKNFLLNEKITSEKSDSFENLNTSKSLQLHTAINQKEPSIKQNDSEKMEKTNNSGGLDVSSIQKTIETVNNDQKSIITSVQNTSNDEKIPSVEEKKPANEAHQIESGVSNKNMKPDSDSLKEELTKKNQTIAHLNSEIINLQKCCNEYSVKYQQLQIKLEEFHEKLQWNQILWKQIGKLKKRIKGLQETIAQTEIQKKDLEYEIIKLGQEVERLQQLNSLLVKKNHLLNSQEKSSEAYSNEGGSGEEPRNGVWKEELKKNSREKFDISERIIKEKENVISQLKSILEMMKDQENAAQKQIAVCKSKIEELNNSGNS